MKNVKEKSKAFKVLSKGIGFVFPAINAYRTNKLVLPAEKRYSYDKEGYAEKVQEIFSSIDEVDDEGILLKEAQSIEDIENERRITIETKATTLVAASGLSLTIIGTLQGIVIKSSNNLCRLDTAVTIVFSLSILYLLSSAICSVHVNRVTGFYFATKDMISEVSKGEYNIKKRIIARKLANVEMNYPRMTIKSNWLDSAQALFLRGVVFIGIGALLLAIQAITTHVPPGT